MEELCSHRWYGKPMVALTGLVVLVKQHVGRVQIEVCESPRQESVVNSGQKVNWTALRSHLETSP